MADESSSTANTTSTCPCETCPQEVTIVYLGEFQEFLEHHAINYLKLKPHITVRLKQVSGGIDALQEHLEEIDWDGSLFPAQTLGAMVESDALWDMSDYVRKSYELDWTEMLPFFRYQTARFGGQTKLIPLDGDLLSMFYRKDLFEQFNITVPRTWDEYNEASKFFHGKSLGPGGTELHGSCVARIDKCGNDYWASLILSSITQSTGTSSGFLLDPDTLNPLFGTAMEETLRLLGEQFQYGHADELTGECLASNFAFNEGHCALTYNWGNQIAISDFIYDIGVAPTPGSQRILDRATGRLVNCTASLCPHGDFYNDIGIVNQVPYSAFGGWAAGVSNASLDSKKYAAADFLAYLSNSLQSLGDVLPNPRSNFAQPYRYSHVTSSNWIDAGFDTKIASEYTETIRQINSENTAMELRVPPASALREVVDEEIFDYLLTIKESPPMTPEVALKLRQEVTVQLDTRIRGIIVAQDQSDIRASYQTSLGYTSIPENESHNYINDNFRHAGWGLGGLICFTSLFIIFWTWRYRNNKAMKAFQPFLLIQSALGLFLMGGTIIPLGFDDSWFSVDVLNITCMLIPWLYVVGFTIFFSSVYAKIRECVHIYKEPHKSHVLLVTPETALRLNMRLLFMNGIVLALWTLVDPLKWMREEVEGGLVFEDGTVETYGACRGESFSSWGFALILFALNLMICMIATLQAFKCRFLVLEYNEMQWLPLSIFPFAETWLVGGPIVVLMRDDPTILFVLLTMMIVCSSVASAMAVFAPKDWYIRKVKYLDSSPKQKKKKEFPERTSSAGILVLKHPTVESQKQLERLKYQLAHTLAINTELEIDIRSMKDKFKELTASEKFAVRESLFTSMADSTNTPEYGSRAVEEFEHTENSRSEMEDINMFQQVWKMPDDEEEDNEEPVIPMPRAGSISEDLDALDSLPKPKMDFEDNAPNALKTFDKQPARKPKLDSMMSKRSAENCWAQVDMGDDDDGFLPTTPESTNISIYEDHDFLKEVVPSGAKLSYTKPNYNAHEFSDSSTGSAHMDDDDFPLTAGADKKLLKNSGSAPMPKESQPMNSMMNTAHIQSFDQSSISDKKFDSSRSNSQKQVMRDYNDNLLPEVAEDREKSQYVHGSTAVVPWPDEDFNDSGSDTSPIRPHSIANQHKHQSNIAIPSEHYTFPDESEQSDSDESDAMVRKKDFRELSSMIEEDDLAALTTKASLLADSLKTKLVDSEIADLSSETEDDKKTTVGNLYGGFGQPKSREASFQQGLSDLELSRIGSENGDRNFVEVSDSILASPARTNGLELPTGGLPMSGTSPDNSNQSGSSSSGFVARAPSGESSGGKDVTHPGAMVNSDYFPHEADEGHVTQKAGEPSQGERRQDRLGVAPRVAAYAEHDVADSTSRRYNNPPQNISQRKPVLFPTSAEAKTTMFKTDDLPPPRSAEKDISGVNTSYSISDWSAVGVTASVLADWSDSCSTSSYGDSVSSMEATTRPSALSTPFANEIDNLVAQFDFDGVKLAAEKYETSMDEHQKVIDEKRRKKRELESWRTSISKTFSK